MSPLVAAPNRGYPDWQRIDNYDSGVLFSLNVLNVTAAQLSPIIDVSRYARLGSFMSVSGDNCQILMQWYMDAAGTVQVGERVFQVAGALFPSHQSFFINLGPFVRVAITPMSSAATNINWVVFGTNRDSVSEVTPRANNLVNVQNLNIGAGANVIIRPSDYASGAALMWVIVTQVFTVLFLALSGSSTFDPTLQISNAAANSNVVQPLALPLGAWALQVVNNGGVAATCDATVVQSNSGAT